MSLLSLNQTEKIDHEVQASACRIESLSEQWLTFQMNEFSPYLGMTPNWTPCVPPAVLLRIYIYGYLHNYLSASIGMGLVQRRSSGR